MDQIKLSKDLDRPWGGWIAFAENEVCTVKILFVKPGQKLSVQSHKKREEMWNVISGRVRLYRGPVKSTLEEIKENLKTYDLEEGMNVLIPKDTVHSLECIGNEPAKILEIMRGEWDEDGDIIRYEDIYGRKTVK